MLEYIGKNRVALIVLHEIYGVNDFIKEACQRYHDEGYDIFCPSLFSSQAVFSYSQEEQAHSVFKNKVGFDSYRDINLLAEGLKPLYEKVFVIGFSVGATLAWRCSESPFFDGIICCYGSRIRDYPCVVPRCPVLVIFALQDTYDVAKVAAQLRDKKDITLEFLKATHGFADCYSKNYSPWAAVRLDELRQGFLGSLK